MTRVTLATLSLQRSLPEMLRERGGLWEGLVRRGLLPGFLRSPGWRCAGRFVPDGGVRTFCIRRVTVRVSEMQRILREMDKQEVPFRFIIELFAPREPFLNTRNNCGTTHFLVFSHCQNWVRFKYRIAFFENQISSYYQHG